LSFRDNKVEGNKTKIIRNIYYIKSPRIKKYN